MKKYFLYLMIGLFMVVDGCKCGGSDSGNGVTNPDTTVAADTTVTGSTEIKIGPAVFPVHPAEFSLTVDVTKAVNAAGIYFRIFFDPAVIQLKDTTSLANSVKEGTFFNKDSAGTNFAVNFLDQNPASGCLVAGLSRMGGTPGVSNSGDIMTFTFKTIKTGSTSVYFSTNTEHNSLFAPGVKDITGVKWTNAQITVK